jgi:hypothetical protein
VSVTETVRASPTWGIAGSATARITVVCCVHVSVDWGAAALGGETGAAVPLAVNQHPNPVAKANAIRQQR